MTKSHPPWPWSVLLAVQEVPPEGLHFHLEADVGTRAAIAKLAQLPAIDRLESDIAAVPHGDGLHVTGRVSATVEQTCVVTLEPMQSEVNELIDVLYLRNPPQSEAATPNPEEEPGRICDERVEALDGGTVDLGVVATEFLMLGIDPYPRKPGVVFAPPPADQVASSPFAALAALKKAPGRGGD
jgi:uncharacterized metal-binding protein YceD (DUF177 family)